MTKANTFTITKTRLKAAHKLAVVGGVDLSDKRKLPTTINKAAKLEELCDSKVAGIFKAAAAAHIIALGEGTWTASKLLGAMLKGKAKADIENLTGSTALYDRIRFYRNAALAFIVSGDMPDSNEARRVDVKTGLVKDAKPKKPSTRTAKGSKQSKAGGALPSEIALANQTGSKVTTNAEGEVVDIPSITPQQVRKAMSPDSMAAFIAVIASGQMVCVHSHDADDKDIAFDGVQSSLNKLCSELFPA